jgi:adenosine kinase
MSNMQLVVSGSIAIDRIMNFSGLYKDLIESSKLEVLSVSVLVDSLHEAHGGTGANIAYNLANLGDKPILLGAVGHNGESYIEFLAAQGVDTSAIHVSELATASFNVLTDTGDNQVGGFYPGAMSDAEGLSFIPWKDTDTFFCISAHDPAGMRRQVEECKTHGLRFMYDIGQQVTNVSAEDIQAGVEAAEIVIVNDYEQEVLLKKAGLTVEALRAKVPVVVSTHGKDGSVIAGKNIAEPISIHIATPVELVDPTGAGDAYRAGFLYGYLRQWDYKICGQLGSVVASFVLEQAGTQVILSLEAIRNRYQSTYNEEIQL